MKIKLPPGPHVSHTQTENTFTGKYLFHGTPQAALCPLPTTGEREKPRPCSLRQADRRCPKRQGPRASLLAWHKEGLTVTCPQLSPPTQLPSKSLAGPEGSGDLGFQDDPTTKGGPSPNQAGPGDTRFLCTSNPTYHKLIEAVTLSLHSPIITQ